MTEEQEPAGDTSEEATEETSEQVPEEDVPAWKNPAYRFVFLFLVYLGAIAWAYPEFRERHIEVVDALAEFTARAEYHLFDLFTQRTAVTDKVVSYKGFAVHIIEECTGVYEVLIFMAAVLAFPTTWSNKGIGLGLGVPLLYLFNVLRIAVLLLVGKHQPQYFDFMHLYFWQATLILMITSVWLLWITQVVNRDWSRSSPDP
ncbi:MAG: exosortase H [bacterium]|nr:exosortase H [bacterium]